MPPDPHGKAPQPAGGEKRQATEGAIEFIEQASGLKLYPYQRALIEHIMALPPGHRFIFAPARRGRLSQTLRDLGSQGSKPRSHGGAATCVNAKSG